MGDDDAKAYLGTALRALLDITLRYVAIKVPTIRRRGAQRDQILSACLVAVTASRAADPNVGLRNIVIGAVAR